MTTASDFLDVEAAKTRRKQQSERLHHRPQSRVRASRRVRPRLHRAGCQDDGRRQPAPPAPRAVAASGHPLIGIVIFVAVGLLAPMVQTSLGALPGPGTSGSRRRTSMPIIGRAREGERLL